MSRIPTKDRDIIEQAMYLPMLLTVLNRDLDVVDKSPFKIKGPYIALIESTMKAVQKDLAAVKSYMYKNKIKVEEVGRDKEFTNYLFLYKGYEEQHNYFNPRLRNRVEDLLREYMNRIEKP